MFVTILTLYLLVVVAFGMTVDETLSFHLRQSKWFALLMSFGVEALSLQNFACSTDAWSETTAALMIFTWTGVVVFELGHEMHMAFTALFVISSLAWASLNSSGYFRIAWIAAVLVPAIVWVTLPEGETWVAEYTATILYIVFWWIYYNISSEMALYAYSSESCPVDWNSWLGIKSQNDTELERYRGAGNRV